jgi:molybdate transport system ATP-binding protein
VKLRGGGAFVVPDHDQHGEVLVALRPSSVVVSVERPHTSARNTWPATIVGLTLLTDRVRLDLEGQPSALVDVTPAAVSELALSSGSQVWLSTKATDLEVYSHDDPTRTTQSR